MQEAGDLYCERLWRSQYECSSNKLVRKRISMQWEAQQDFCIGCVGADLLETAYPLWDGDIAIRSITLNEDDGRFVSLHICY